MGVGQLRKKLPVPTFHYCAMAVNVVHIARLAMMKLRYQKNTFVKEFMSGAVCMYELLHEITTGLFPHVHYGTLWSCS